MKKSLWVLYIGLLLTLGGCGGGGGGSSSEAVKIPLVIGEETPTQEGDQLVAEDARTIIEVDHSYDVSRKTVTLIQGSASLLRGNYELAD